MKIKNAEGNEIEVKLKPFLGRHADKGFNLFINLAEGEEVTTKGLMSYMEFLDNLACELSGMSKEELGNLPEEEKQKVIGYFQKRIESKVDFLKSSLKQANSVPPDIAQ